MIDPDILSEFQKEAKGLLRELEESVEELENTSDTFPAKQLETFAQRIDRIMGAAQTLATLDPGHDGLKMIGAIAQLCKRMGYKASEYKLAVLIPIFAAFWADTIEVLDQLIDAIGDEAKTKSLKDNFGAVLQKRLAWLTEKVQQLAPTAAKDFRS